VIEVHSPSDRGPLRILQVEDSSADAELVVHALRSAGLEFRHECVDTREGWERALLEPEGWDVVLLDYSLPQLDTLELLAELGERASHLPAIVVSGTITEDLAVAALRAGARDFVTKTNLTRLAPAILREAAVAWDGRERRVAEAERDESDARFARFVENAQDIVIRRRVSPQTFEYVSPSVTTILGYLPAEFYADPVVGQRLVHPDDREKIEEAYADDPERPVLARALAADGRTVWLDRRQVAIRDEQGKVVVLEAVLRDVTVQVVAHEQLQAEERKFRAVFEGALDALLLVEDDRVVLEANPAAGALFDLPIAAIVGRRIEELVQPVGGAELAAAWSGLRDAGRLEGEVTVVRPDGTTRVAELRAAGNVKPGVHLSVLRDITDRLEAEVALHENNDRIEAMLGQLPLVVFSVPLVEGSSPSYVSPQTEELFGLPVEAWGESPELFWDAVHPDDLELLQKAQLEEGAATDFRLRRPNGDEVWVHGQNRFLRDADGNPTRYQGFFADITELMTSREALRETENQLRQGQKMEALGRLAGGIAHDFNNLLLVINGYGDLALARANGDDALRRSITEIRRAGDRAAELTQQLLALSRQQVLKPEVLDLNSVVSDHANMLSRLLGEDIDLRVALNSSGGFIEADAGQLAQVVLNLASNARDAMPDGGELLIRTGSVQLTGKEAALSLPEGRYAVLEVRDTGTGMSPATVSRVFEPFFTTKEVGAGTGLGLSTVLGIVEQSRGAVEIDSKPGEGTRFQIYLPEVDAPLVGTDGPAPRLEDHDGTENVLLVEDDPVVRSLIEDMLVERGYTVLATASPLLALKALATYEDEIQLVVTDVVMPEMNGRQLAERIQTDRPNIRTLYMSGYTSDAIMARGVLPAGMHFLQKPFTAFQLAEKAREALAPRSS
jgi:two-component system cell cycle sensor histidine kinase/response regulator CckA